MTRDQTVQLLNAFDELEKERKHYEDIKQEIELTKWALGNLYHGEIGLTLSRRAGGQAKVYLPDAVILNHLKFRVEQAERKVVELGGTP